MKTHSPRLIRSLQLEAAKTSHRGTARKSVLGQEIPLEIGLDCCLVTAVAKIIPIKRTESY